MSFALPYAGVRVLDLSQGVAMPHCGMLLAQYGADVVKVEPLGGDWSRVLGQRYGEHSALAVAYNVGKRSIALDLKTPQAVEAVLRLAESADLVLESFRPGVMRRLGLGYEALKARNPRVIYASVSGFGQHGPYRERPCSDTVAQAFSGFMSVNRGEDGIPHKVNTIIMDAVTGIYAFGAVAAALAGRHAEQEGIHLDLSLTGCAASVQSAKFVEHAMEGGDAARLNSPAGTYRTADGWIALTLTKEVHFLKMCEAIGLPALARDERFASFATRAENHDLLAARIAARLVERTTQCWRSMLHEADVLCETVMDHGDWLADEHVRATGAAQDLDVAGMGRVPLPVTPGRSAHRGTSPGIGEHTQEILYEAGFEQATLDSLRASGALGSGDACRVPSP